MSKPYCEDENVEKIVFAIVPFGAAYCKKVYLLVEICLKDQY